MLSSRYIIQKKILFYSLEELKIREQKFRNNLAKWQVNLQKTSKWSSPFPCILPWGYGRVTLWSFLFFYQAF
jgi:hypothetical protein